MNNYNLYSYWSVEPGGNPDPVMRFGLLQLLGYIFANDMDWLVNL